MRVAVCAQARRVEMGFVQQVQVHHVRGLVSHMCAFAVKPLLLLS